MLLEWNWVAFSIGTLGAFIMELVRFLKQNKTFTEIVVIGDSKLNTTKFNYLALFISIVYILVGGAIAGIFANTKQEALLYGGLWQALFTYVIKIDKN